MGNTAGWLWCYESPIARSKYEYEQAALYEANLLGARERADLLAHWREQFDRAGPGDFSHCLGVLPGTTTAAWLHGDAARNRHYEWAGIPDSLIKRWTAAQRRRQTRRAANEEQFLATKQRLTVNARSNNELGE